MNKIKNLILWFTNFIAKKNRLKIKNTEKKFFYQKKILKKLSIKEII